MVSVTHSGALDLFQHPKDRAGLSDKKAFEHFGKAATLKSVSTGASAFSHERLRYK